jgi:hypothetical protein
MQLSAPLLQAGQILASGQRTQPTLRVFILSEYSTKLRRHSWPTFVSHTRLNV